MLLATVISASTNHLPFAIYVAPDRPRIWARKKADRISLQSLFGAIVCRRLAENAATRIAGQAALS